ncbi:hypothetical protein [Xanthocytophaga agilis]|uniref:Uncharacterized protein n=1 Tax=Xanthocytophaga agilis TaxID=3048010 RepID=A0AAE3R1T9_9BACT|nr:hypothetical protein [Xanthocytophaga agilis]MDJ1502116.1 hypothetical protein [Xanthocytophaga agilis]
MSHFTTKDAIDYIQQSIINRFFEGKSESFTHQDLRAINTINAVSKELPVILVLIKEYALQSITTINPKVLEEIYTSIQQRRQAESKILSPQDNVLIKRYYIEIIKAYSTHSINLPDLLSAL